MSAVAAPIASQRRIPRWLIALLIVVGLLTLACLVGSFALARYVTTPRFRINGASMAPCFADGAMLTTSKLDEGGRLALRHGDIVVYDAPLNVDRKYIQRIVAVGGDQITIRNGQVVLNGAVLDEPYVAQPPLYRYPLRGDEPETVPANSVVVLGDNRNNSADSHGFGAVALNRVTHKVASSCMGQP
jgi:signal peptidase I